MHCCQRTWSAANCVVYDHSVLRRALQLFDRAMELAPESSLYIGGKAGVLMKLKDYVQASQLFAEANKMDSENHLLQIGTFDRMLFQTYLCRIVIHMCAKW